MSTDVLHKANKGEWSELYTLFKIFCDRKIAAASADLQPLAGEEYDFVKVFREEVKGEPYEYNLSQPGYVKIIDKDGNTVKIISTEGLSQKVEKILNALKAADKSSFEMSGIIALMSEYLITKVKASSLEKTDILAEVSSQLNQGQKTLGFSIKSHIGNLPTLVNSSSHTNFVYQVVGFTGDLNAVNAIDERHEKIRKRVAAIHMAGGNLNFSHVTSETFTTNLRLSDTKFPAMFAQMLYDYYSGKGSDWGSLVPQAASKSHLDVTSRELRYKLQGFLRSAALGMVPSKEWDGKLSTYGGYIVVLDDGRLVCYHLFNDDEFKDYMIKNTKFDTPSTGKFHFGELYEEDSKLMINLNFQIRFLK